MTVGSPLTDTAPLVRYAICKTAYPLKDKAVDYGIGLLGGLSP